MLPLLTVHSGDWYNAEQVEKSITVLTDALGNRGYAFVEVKPEIRRNRKSHTIDITFDVQEGPRVYVERIDIVGNVRTLDKVIRREFRLVEGDAFNSTKMQRSKERIKNFGFFKKVEVTNAPGSAPDKTVVTVEVEEQSTGELSLGLGFSTTRRPARGHQHPRAQFSRARPGFAHRNRGLVPVAAGRPELYRALFPRPKHRGWFRYF